MPKIFVDYTLVGHARRFKTPVKRRVRCELHNGDTVVVFGDDVPEAQARVLHVSPDVTDVEFELLDV